MRREWITLNAAITAAASAVGGKEADGPLGDLFDLRDGSDRFGKDTWEDAESEMQRLAFNVALSKRGVRDVDVGALFAGDLLNQCVGSSYGLLAFDTPFVGLYGACSTAAESLMLASLFVTHDIFPLCGAVTSSHYCSAERQFRTPVEYGAQRSPTAQWTVTGAGAFLTERAVRGGAHAVVTRAQIGRAIDMGVKDASNMGAAMAPAAADTLKRFFEGCGSRPEDYSLIVTGDLGFEGSAILGDLMRAEGYPLGARYTDCGCLIYERVRQDVHGGGSGCGCSATVLASHLLPKLCAGEWDRILFLGTGAMMSPDSLKQGKGIAGIAHLLEIVSPRYFKEKEENEWTS
ncbi:MAG: stage V sporulation protein AD [Ruminococcaceae bacterium]|nr:stage V sporulation protein AD [Oscillospiraceae bacterium]